MAPVASASRPQVKLVQAAPASGPQVRGPVGPLRQWCDVNALTDEGAAGVSRAYSPAKLDRLTALKDTWDPGNVFHLNHNIPHHLNRHRGSREPPADPDRRSTRYEREDVGLMRLEPGLWCRDAVY
jgi:hypothetical protein